MKQFRARVFQPVNQDVTCIVIVRYTQDGGQWISEQLMPDGTWKQYSDYDCLDTATVTISGQVMQEIREDLVEGLSNGLIDKKVEQLRSEMQGDIDQLAHELEQATKLNADLTKVISAQASTADKLASAINTVASKVDTSSRYD